MFPKLQYVSQGKTIDEQIINIGNALKAGCTWIQLRFKNAGQKDLRRAAEKAKELCLSCKAVFIINDHPHLAASIDADGVHLGLQDMPVTEARAILGSEKIIGGTANTFEDVVQRYTEGCNYVGVGPFRFTTTKDKLSPILGAVGYASIIAKMKEEKIQFPLYAIGGIALADLEAIMHTGVYGIAVSGMLTHHAYKNELVQQLNAFLHETVNNSY